MFCSLQMTKMAQRNHTQNHANPRQPKISSRRKVKLQWWEQPLHHRIRYHSMQVKESMKTSKASPQPLNEEETKPNPPPSCRTNDYQSQPHLFWRLTTNKQALYNSVRKKQGTFKGALVFHTLFQVYAKVVLPWRMENIEPKINHSPLSIQGYLRRPLSTTPKYFRRFKLPIQKP